jgi:hypothetical protein
MPSDEPVQRAPSLLPGRYAGGAEMSTEEMWQQAPEGVQVVPRNPRVWVDDLDEFDRIVVGSPESMSDVQMRAAGERSPVLWLRSPHTERIRPLLESARLLVWPSHECAAWHSWWRGPYEVCPAPLDVTLIPRGVPKENFALWAGRSVGHKGVHNAVSWAEQNGVELRTLTNVPRNTVLEAMGRARWFVHLPIGPVDPCPRTVIEAEIAGCEIVVNDLVGRVPVRGADAVAEFVAGSAERFWSWTLNA